MSAESAAPATAAKGGKKKNNKATVKTVKGMADWQPEQMALRERIFDTVRRAFRRHGAVTIQTPIAELKSTLTGKYGEDTKLIYDLADQGGEISALRYDLTVPFARFVGTHGVRAIKRYQIGRVYRRDQPGKGRYREFFQCDFDIAGEHAAMQPDAECCALLMEALDALELDRFVLKVNHRRLLDAMFQACGVAAGDFATVCSSVDKLDKLPPAKVIEELVQVKGQAADVVGKLMDLLQSTGAKQTDARATVAWLRDSEEFAFVRNSPQSQEAAAAAISDLEMLLDYVDAFGRLADGRLQVELSLARGLDYYTGIILEAVYVGDKSAVGSIAGGGRYDGLVGMFSATPVPSVGFSLGVERIFTILEARYKKEKRELPAEHTKVFVVSMGDKMEAERMRTVSKLWAADIPAAMYTGTNDKLLPQLKKAKGMPLAVIVGGDEGARGELRVKCVIDTARDDVVVPVDELVPTVQRLLAELE